MVAKNKGRIPRNKKKAWRKQIDISHVEDYLEDVRLQQRFGGLLEKKEDESLFSVDKQPCESPPPSASRRGRQPLDTSQLKCFSSLRGLPGADVPFSSNWVKDKQQVFVREKKASRKLLREERQAQAEAGRSAPVTDKKDLWAEEQTSDSERDAWLEPGIRQRQRGRALCLARRPVHLKNTMTPAVQLPDPGQSYHPEEKDHDQLIARAMKVEMNRLEEERKWEKQTTDKFPSALPTESEYLAEMSGGLPGHQSDPEEEAGAADSQPGPVRKVPKPKTRQQRRRAKIHQLSEKQRLEAVRLRREQAQVYRIRSIRRELDAVDRQYQERREARAERRCRHAATRRLRLGRCRQPAPEVAAEPTVVLTDQLPGSLRRVSFETHPLRDRYLSLLRRNVIEAREKVKHKRKYKLKRFARITASDREPNKVRMERTL